MFDKKIIWIASYPRSGNTWLRFILSSLFFEFKDFDNKWNMTKLIPDIHINTPEEIFGAPSVKDKLNDISFCKTHHSKPTDIKNRLKLQGLKTVGYIYIYRHPLDVLISAINFSYYKGISKFFLDGKLRTPSQLYETGNIDQYLINFTENATEIKIWNKMSGSWLENVYSWCLLQKHYEPSIIINYDNLLENPLKELMVLHDYFPKLEKNNIIQSLEIARKLTYSNKQNSFFWKKETGTHKKYFNKNLISVFNKKYGDILSELSLDCEYS